MSEEMNNSLVCETVVSNNIFGGVGCETYTDRGIVGESAYEQAVAGGYTGTKQEFEQLLAYDLTTIADGIDDVVENLPAIQAASENADKAQKWAEGTDAQVTPIGGVHSSKGWANVAKGYADSIDLTNYRTAAAQDAIDITKQPKTLSEPITVNGQSQTTVEEALNAINENSSIANASLSNITNDGKQAIVTYAMPDYANETTVTVAAGTWTRVAKDSFVITHGGDVYTEDYFVYVSPDNGTTKYVVGFRFDDTNAQTEGISFSFFVPKGWYFTSNVEQGYTAHIYPLKGAQ